jgi:endonuclease YncB( thermonuclease family)
VVTALLLQAAFICTPVSVWDGDGPIHCAEGPRVRLARIAARELDGSCRPGHPCPSASGVAARDHLVRLLGGARGRTRDGHIRVRGPRLSCRANGMTYGRVAAWCSAPRIGDLGEAMVRDGFAMRW